MIIHKTHFNYIISFVLVSIAIGAIDQEISAQDKDFGLWSSFQIETEWSDHFELDVEVGYRLKDNLKQRDESLIQAGLTYKYWWISASAGYRFANENVPSRTYSLSHRWITQMEFEPEWKRFNLGYRLRYQSQYTDISSSENGHIPDNFIRQRFQIDYNIRKFPVDPFFHYEVFTIMGKSLPAFSEKYRASAGVVIKINKDNSMKISYMKNDFINNNDQTESYILKLEYKLEI